MLTRPRIVAIACVLFALIAGYFSTGHLLYKLPIGLDPSGFALGDSIQSIARTLSPDLSLNVAGIVWLAVSLLAIATIAFFAMRTSVRAEAASSDASRRRFLTGAWGVALGSLVTAAAAAAARGMYGIGHGGRGWLGINESIQAPVVKTHPEWMESWKGSRVRSYRRLGRTDWKVSDIVLGTGQISRENGEATPPSTFAPRQPSITWTASTLITSAPRSPSSAVQNGPAHHIERSTIRTPSSGCEPAASTRERRDRGRAAPARGPSEVAASAKASSVC